VIVAFEKSADVGILQKAMKAAGVEGFVKDLKGLS
jgi:hypothetical protein